jgi:hypothetical protein
MQATRLLLALAIGPFVIACGDDSEAGNESDEGPELTILEVRSTDSTGANETGFSSARIVQPGDTLPVIGTAAVDILIADETGRRPPSAIDSFRLATAESSKCTIIDAGSCVGTTCRGEFQINAWGVCWVGFLVETPEADGVVCWEHSIVDAMSVGDAAYHAEAEPALEACQALRSKL